MYCGLSTASEVHVFFIFTTHRYAQLRHLKCTIVKDVSRREYSGPPLMRPPLGNENYGCIRGVAAGEG